jgi:hypothetical protein
LRHRGSIERESEGGKKGIAINSINQSLSLQKKGKIRKQNKTKTSNFSLLNKGEIRNAQRERRNDKNPKQLRNG